MLCIPVFLYILTGFEFIYVLFLDSYFNIELTEASMLTLSGAPSTTSHIGYYHLSVFGLLNLVHI